MQYKTPKPLIFIICQDRAVTNFINILTCNQILKLNHIKKQLILEYV